MIEAEISDLSHAELWRRHGISRPTDYKWIRRFRQQGLRPLLKGRKVGLEPIGDGVFTVYFGPLRLGWLDEVDYRIMDVKERARRCR